MALITTIPGCQTSPSKKEEPETFEVGTTKDDDGAEAGDTLENAGIHESSPGFQTCASAIVGSAAEDEAGTIRDTNAPTDDDDHGTTHDDDDDGTTHDDGAEASPLASLIRAISPCFAPSGDGGGGGVGETGDVGPSPVQSLL